MPDIDFINGAPHIVADTEIAAMVPAFQAYVDRYLNPHWGFAAGLHFVPAVAQANPLHWWIVLNAHSDQPGALGYHAVQPNGLPYSRIFAGDDRTFGVSLSVTASHELAEMLGDPAAEKTADIDGKLYVFELCDACEDDAYAIAIDGVPCSDFVLPAYFISGSPGPWDYRGVLKGPCPSLSAGGYMEFFEGGQWHQVTARLADGARSYRSGRNGRSQQRAGRPLPARVGP